MNTKKSSLHNETTRSERKKRENCTRGLAIGALVFSFTVCLGLIVIYSVMQAEVSANSSILTSISSFFRLPVNSRLIPMFTKIATGLLYNALGNHTNILRHEWNNTLDTELEKQRASLLSEFRHNEEIEKEIQRREFEKQRMDLVKNFDNKLNNERDEQRKEVTMDYKYELNKQKEELIKEFEEKRIELTMEFDRKLKKEKDQLMHEFERQKIEMNINFENKLKKEKNEMIKEVEQRCVYEREVLQTTLKKLFYRELYHLRREIYLK